VISGSPEIRYKILGRTKDMMAMAAVWECGAVSYRWHYHQDEAYVVLSGEGFITDANGVEHRYGPGDVAFFAAGTDSTWRHPDHFRKIAVLTGSSSGACRGGGGGMEETAEDCRPRAQVDVSRLFRNRSWFQSRCSLSQAKT